MQCIEYFWSLDCNVGTVGIFDPVTEKILCIHTHSTQNTYNRLPHWNTHTSHTDTLTLPTLTLHILTHSLYQYWYSHNTHKDTLTSLLILAHSYFTYWHSHITYINTIKQHITRHLNYQYWHINTAYTFALPLPILENHTEHNNTHSHYLYWYTHTTHSYTLTLPYINNFLCVLCNFSKT